MFFLAIILVLLLMNHLICTGVTGVDAHDKFCTTKGPCPDDDPTCFKFCIDRHYDLGGTCIGDQCCCDH